MTAQNEVDGILALRRIADALESIAKTLQSLDEPQTFDLQHDKEGRVIQIHEV